MSKNLNPSMDPATAKAAFYTKEVLTAEETAQYMGISKNYLYKLTMRRAIPFYKPLGKKCYFNRKEVEAWLQSNKCASTTEINDRANKILMQRGGVL